jgi:hypothetical protein
MGDAPRSDVTMTCPALQVRFPILCREAPVAFDRVQVILGVEAA